MAGLVFALALTGCAVDLGKVDRQPAIVSQIRDSAQAHFDLREPLTREQVGIKDYPPYYSIVIDRQGGPLLDVRLTLTDDVTFTIDAFEIAFLADPREKAGPPQRVTVNAHCTSLANAEEILSYAQRTVLLDADGVDRRLVDLATGGSGISRGTGPVGEWYAIVEARPDSLNRGTGLLSFTFYAVDSPLYRNITAPRLAEEAAQSTSPGG